MIEELIAQAEMQRQRRAEQMPTEQDAINALFQAHTRLTELGWANPIYCPKDGTRFQVIEAGSTGIFEGWYDGEWPNGHWWIVDGGETYPSRPVLWKALAAQPEEAPSSAP